MTRRPALTRLRLPPGIPAILAAVGLLALGPTPRPFDIVPTAATPVEPAGEEESREGESASPASSLRAARPAPDTAAHPPSAGRLTLPRPAAISGPPHPSRLSAAGPPAPHPRC